MTTDNVLVYNLPGYFNAHTYTHIYNIYFNKNMVIL